MIDPILTPILMEHRVVFLRPIEADEETKHDCEDCAGGVANYEVIELDNKRWFWCGHCRIG